MFNVDVRNEASYLQTEWSYRGSEIPNFSGALRGIQMLLVVLQFSAAWFEFIQYEVILQEAKGTNAAYGTELKRETLQRMMEGSFAIGVLH